jgi:hypothetical protein
VLVLAYGIVASEVLPDELTAHNHFVRSIKTFVAGKKPAVQQENPESAKKSLDRPSASARQAGLRPA